MNPCRNLKLLVMVRQKFVMVEQMPAHAHPWLCLCCYRQHAESKNADYLVDLCVLANMDSDNIADVLMFSVCEKSY